MVLFRTKNAWAFEASLLEWTVFSINLNTICNFSSRFVIRLFHDVLRAEVPYTRVKYATNVFVKCMFHVQYCFSS